MDKDKVLQHLDNFRHNRSASVVEIAIVHFALEKGLLIRKHNARYTLTPKGERFLEGTLSWDDLIRE
jgi:predicted transcriptional regulator